MTEKILIPNRFESILTNDVFKNFTPLLLPVEEDLAKFIKLNNKIKIQNGGILSFILGNSGVGKTTSIYSATVFNSEHSNPFATNHYSIRTMFCWLGVP